MEEGRGGGRKEKGGKGRRGEWRGRVGRGGAGTVIIKSYHTIQILKLIAHMAISNQMDQRIWISCATPQRVALLMASMLNRRDGSGSDMDSLDPNPAWISQILILTWIIWIRILAWAQRVAFMHTLM